MVHSVYVLRPRLRTANLPNYGHHVNHERNNQLRKLAKEQFIFC